MAPEFELIGPLWADFGGREMYLAAVGIEVIAVIGLSSLLVSAMRRGSPLMQWGVAAFLASICVIVLNGAVNAVVLRLFVSAYKGGNP